MGMTDAEILQAVFKKIHYDIVFDDHVGAVIRNDWEMFAKDLQYYTVIFTHDFAKAFWKPKDAYEEFDQKEIGQDWQYHLQQMVLEEDPIKYLERFI